MDKKIQKEIQSKNQIEFDQLIDKSPRTFYLKDRTRVCCFPLRAQTSSDAATFSFPSSSRPAPAVTFPLNKIFNSVVKEKTA